MARKQLQIGNPLTYRDGMTMSWANGRQLQSIETPEQTVSFGYDASGARISKTTNGVTHSYYNLGGQVAHETRGDQRITYLIDESGKYYGLRLSSIQNPSDATFYYFIFNLQGDVIGLANDNHDVVLRYEYDAWVAAGLTITVKSFMPYSNSRVVTTASFRLKK